jgi:NADPH:quinone reductase
MVVCKSFGADHVIDYVAKPEWEKEVMRITDGHGVDVVFDPLGTISQSMKCAAFDARLVPIGFVGGQIKNMKVNQILLKNISIVGLHWDAHAQFDPDMIPEVWEGLFKLIEKGKYRSTVFQADNVKPFVGLEHVDRALKLLEDKTSRGKVVIDVLSSGKSRL